MQYISEHESHNLGWSAISTLFVRYRWLILAVSLVTVLTGWAVLQVFFTELYESQSTALVKVGRETSEVPSSVVNGNLLSQGVRLQDINSEVQMLSSPKLVEDAVDKIGPERFKSVLKEPESPWGYPKYYARVAARAAKDFYKEVLYAMNLKKRLPLREEVILGISESMRVEPVKESDVLVLKVLLPSPELAREAANEILAGYLRSRGDVRRNGAARDYFVEQTQSYRNQMDALEERRAQVRDTWGLTSATEQRSLILKQLLDLEAEKVDLEGQIKKLTKEREDMALTLASMPEKLIKEETFTRNPALQSIKERITNLEMERARVLGRYQENSEPAKQLQSEIAELQAALAAEQSTVLETTVSEVNPMRREFERGVEERIIAIAGLTSRLLKLNDPIQEHKNALAQLNQGADAYESAERDYRLTEQAYLTFHQRMDEAKLSEGLDERNLANVSIISPPSLPLEPVYPRKLFIMGLLLPAGLVVGVGIAGLLETLNDRIRDGSDLQALPGIPLLGTVRGELTGKVEI